MTPSVSGHTLLKSKVQIDLYSVCGISRDAEEGFVETVGGEGMINVVAFAVNSDGIALFSAPVVVDVEE